MPSIYVYYDFGSQTIGICPKRGKLYAKIPGKNRCSRSESGILQPASRTGHGICQTFEPIPAFEIIKVGKMWVKRKMRKNATITLYFNML